MLWKSQHVRSQCVGGFVLTAMRGQATNARMTKNDQGSAAGGVARAKAMSAEERQQSAQLAAVSRWNPGIKRATHAGELRIGNASLSAAVLDDGVRILTQSTFLTALGRSRSPKAGTGVLSTVDGTPFFLQAEVLKPFISEELMASTAPIAFLDKSGKKMFGYNAEALPGVAEVYLKFRDAMSEQGKPTPKQYEHIIRACDATIRSLAKVGIIALVDEATGYQEIRDKHALRALLDKYLGKELGAWAKRFPDDFYKEIFRLRRWEWRGLKMNKPRCVAHYTTNIVYDRLAPGLVEELERRNPTQENGTRKAKHHQWLTDDVGHPALSQHLHAVTGLMRANASWESFKRQLDRAFPKKGDTLQLPFAE